MSALILTPEARHYLIAIVMVLGLSGSTVADRLYQRWLFRSRLSFSSTYAWVLCVTIVLGSRVTDLRALLATGPLRAAAAGSLGCALGWIAFVIDRAINRRVQRRSLRQRQQAASQRSQNREARVLRALAAAGTAGAGERGAQQRALAAESSRGIGLTGLLAIAALEEAVFRGVLLALALSIAPAVLAWCALLLVTLVFAVQHVHFGWSHVLGKLPFSLLVTLGTVMSGTLLLPIAAHVTLNVLVYQYVKQLSQSTTRLAASAVPLTPR